MTDGTRRGKADLHIHSMASDGVSGVAEILDQVRSRTDLDVIAFTDHERIDAGVAAREMARDSGSRVEVIVGEEISTRGGHLLGLFLEQRIRPWHSLRDSVAMIHDQGGIAVIAHPLVPYPLCASGRSIRRLMDDPDERVHPDGIEAFNPTTAAMRWQRQIPPFVEELGLAAVGNSDSHHAATIGQGYSTFPGRTADELRAAILARETDWHGAFYPWRHQFRTFGKQLRKNAAAIRDEVGGKVLRTGTGRDLGYPGGRARPARYDPTDPRSGGTDGHR
jgi:predicted metal-dependent phosphoesterase TrpH